MILGPCQEIGDRRQPGEGKYGWGKQKQGASKVEEGQGMVIGPCQEIGGVRQTKKRGGWQENRGGGESIAERRGAETMRQQ